MTDDFISNQIIVEKYVFKSNLITLEILLPTSRSSLLLPTVP